MNKMDKVINLIKPYVMADFPNEKDFGSKVICFCTKDLLTSFEEDTITNFLYSKHPEEFYVRLYAAFENGKIHKYSSHAPMESTKISGWSFELLRDKELDYEKKLQGFAIYLSLPDSYEAHSHLLICKK